MSWPMGETVEILEWVDGTDPYGDPIEEWAPKRAVPGCLVWPRTSEDMAGGLREGRVIGMSVTFPPGTQPAAADRLRIRGDVHTIDGAPADWRSGLTGWAPGVLVNTKRVEG